MSDLYTTLTGLVTMRKWTPWVPCALIDLEINSLFLNTLFKIQDKNEK